MYAGMYVDMYVGMYVGTCVEPYVRICVDMYAGMGVDMCLGIHVDMRVDLRSDNSGRHVWRLGVDMCISCQRMLMHMPNEFLTPPTQCVSSVCLKCVEHVPKACLTCV